MFNLAELRAWEEAYVANPEANRDNYPGQLSDKHRKLASAAGSEIYTVIITDEMETEYVYTIQTIGGREAAELEACQKLDEDYPKATFPITYRSKKVNR